MSPVTPDTSVILVNQAINDALRVYLDEGVAIRFDLPDPESLPAEPTISVFMYDIHEDLRLNSKESRQYREGMLVPGKVNICCNYLITYWGVNQATSNGSPGSGPNNQAIIVMNKVMNALINSRELLGMPGAFTRVMPPKEELNSLGNFWQSLGNKPRLALNYVVTIPVSLNDKQESVPPVKSSQLNLEKRN
jgi:hypothetical protein